MKNLLRNLAYASVILAALSFTIHNLNQPAQAQIGGQNIVACSGGDSNFSAVAGNGDVYTVVAAHDLAFQATYRGNIFTGGAGPTPIQPTTWSGVKTHIKN